MLIPIPDLMAQAMTTLGNVGNINLFIDSE